MKAIIRFFFAAVIIGGSAVTATAQQSSEPVIQRQGKYEVNTRLTEKKGTYEQRKLYRSFLEDYMRDCPYISRFSIHEVAGAPDNHDVIWQYQVNSWNDITQFYGWVNEQIKKSSKNNGLKKALTPFQPDYAIGGQIQIERRSKAALAKD